MKAAVLSDTIYLKDRKSMRTVSKTSGVARKTGEAMTELLIVADDFTGALDTGVQFASRGVSTRVFAESTGDLAAAFAEVQVVVVNSETRHKTPAEAYGTVFRLAAQARDTESYRVSIRRTIRALTDLRETERMSLGNVF